MTGAIKELSIQNPKYSSNLKNIFNPPTVLFYLGELSEAILNKPKIAIVGSRQADKEGIEIAYEFGRILALNGVTVVSGLALGIDTAAHRGALDSHLPASTIAVLGNGLPQIYPRTNEKLGRKIVEQGGIIFSQFEPNETAWPQNFLDRNRIIAGLSIGVVVIQAVERSGSLVTSRYALEEGREVMVVPGSIKNHRYKGSNQLIRDGAIAVTTPEEVLTTVSLERTSSTDDALRTAQNEDNRANMHRCPILALLHKSGPIPMDELRRKLNSPSDFASRLLELELAGAIERLPGNQVGIK